MKENFTIPSWSPDNTKAVETTVNVGENIRQMLKSYITVTYKKPSSGSNDATVVCFCGRCDNDSDEKQVWVIRKSIIYNENDETTTLIEPKTIDNTDDILNHIEYNHRPFCEKINISPKKALMWFVESVNTLTMLYYIDNAGCDHIVAIANGETVSEYDFYMENFTEREDKPLTMLKHCPNCGMPINQILGNNQSGKKEEDCV